MIELINNSPPLSHHFPSPLLPTHIPSPLPQSLILLVLSTMVTTVVLGETITRGSLPLKVREYRNVWFPSKYESDHVVTLKQTVLTSLLNGPMIVEGTETSDVSMEREGLKKGLKYTICLSKVVSVKCLIRQSHSLTCNAFSN